MGKGEKRQLSSGKVVNGERRGRGCRRPTELQRAENLLALVRRGWLTTRGQR